MMPSITIRIDYGSEGGETARTNVATTGSLPMPDASAFASSAAAAQATTGPPSPLDNATQAMGSAAIGSVDSAPPSPVLDFVTTASAGAFGAGLSNSAPTPFAGGGFSAEMASRFGDGVPTPFDSSHGAAIANVANVANGGVPEPDPESLPPSGDRAPDVSSRPGEGPTRKGRR
jgi:hypothetical protein